MTSDATGGPDAESWVVLGFGEAASGLIGAGLLNGARYRVCLPLGRAPSARTSDRLSQHEITPSLDPSGVRGARIVLSLVTPDSALDVAQAVAPHLDRGALYVDFNSIAARTAHAIAEIVEGRGARFVDAAVMGPVPLLKLRVPVWLSGGAAGEFREIAQRRGLNTTVVSERAGDASALKMLWSVMTKGTIGLYAEALVAAHRLGLLQPMLEMIAREYGVTGTSAMILRMLGSTAASGERRLGEMEEARKTLEDAGVPAWTVAATVKWIAALNGLPGVADARDVPDVVKAASEALETRLDAAKKPR
jgi:3-hydroxyisobutyrate dehydrogenase-like beta-hydroxyacid dehydrogenase